MRYLDLKNDLTFKKIFAEHPHLLISFLNSVLPLDETRKIQSIEYLPAELTPVVPLFKYTIVDVRCKDTSGRQFIVEMQMLWTNSFQNRVLFNASKAYVKQLEKGEQYDLLQPVYALSLVNQNFVAGTDAYFHHYKIVTLEKPQLQMKGLEFIFVELPKVKARNVKDKAMGILWLRLISDIDNFMKTVSKDSLDSGELKQAIDLLQESAYTKEELETYERYWDSVRVEKALISDALEKGFEKGKTEGKIEGKVEGKIEGQFEKAEEMIVSGFKEGIEIEILARMAGYSPTEVEEILKKNKLV